MTQLGGEPAYPSPRARRRLGLKAVIRTTAIKPPESTIADVRMFRLRKLGAAQLRRMDASGSVLDSLDAKALKMREAVLHGLELLGRMPLPIGDLAGDPERITGAV